MTRAQARRAIARAQAEGFCAGRADRHTSRAWYPLPSQWRAWLDGWRQGQREFIAERQRLLQEQAAQLAQDERIARRAA